MPRSTSQNFCCQCPCPHGERQPPPTSGGDPPTLKACGILVPTPGIEPAPTVVEVQSLNLWTVKFDGSADDPVGNPKLKTLLDTVGWNFGTQK